MVFFPHLRPHDFANGQSFQTHEPCRGVAGNQQKLHPARGMPEQGKEQIDDSKVRTRQRRAPGIMKIGISDQLAAQRAGRWHIALDDSHAGFPR
jgi:hypothetical protein